MASALGLPEAAVRRGKPLDVLGLKGTSLDGIRAEARSLAATAAELYAPARGRREVGACPCCELDAAGAPEALRVHGVPYHRCGGCGHLFVRSQPAPEALNEGFAGSEEHAAVYTDRDSLELRLAQIVAPKVDWSLETFLRERGRAARSVVDVGAGGGHFVEAARRRGLAAEGYEISAPSRRFAREAFGLELRPDDFLTEPPRRGAYDLVTFWGLLEYTPEPRRFLEAAHEWLDPAGGLLVVEVPRAECLGTAVQTAWSGDVVRHLSPTTHVNCFSDGSLAAALERSGFRAVGAWYFGMDAYELLVQLALASGAPDAFDRLAEGVLALQPLLDGLELCDDIVVAAVPA